MRVEVHLHNRSSSPTVREATAAANVRVDDNPLPGATGSSTRRSIPNRFDSIPKVKYYSGGRMEERASGKSYTTFSWPADSVFSDLHHPHKALNCSTTFSMSIPTQLADRLQRSHRGAPVLHPFEMATAALSRQIAGKNKLDAAVQTLVNAKEECVSLKSKYDLFTVNARTLLSQSSANSCWNGSPEPVPTALTQIINSFWPTLRFESSAEKDAWVKRTLSDVRPFIAQTYDALDLALGRITVAIPLAKSDVYDEGRSRSDAEKNAIMTTMRETDRVYSDTLDAFENNAIPIDDEFMKSHSLVATLRAEPNSMIRESQ